MPTRDGVRLNTAFETWEDEDHNRYFPIGDDRARVRDGCFGTWRGIVEIEPADTGDTPDNADK